jgi:hypothetical protein
MPASEHARINKILKQYAEKHFAVRFAVRICR